MFDKFGEMCYLECAPDSVIGELRRVRCVAGYNLLGFFQACLADGSGLD